MSTPTTGVGWIPEDTFAARLLLARRHLNLSVKEAAERCHVHYATWSTWERGSTPQNYRDIVLRVSEGLGVNRDWLAWGGVLSTNAPDQGRAVTVGYLSAAGREGPDNPFRHSDPFLPRSGIAHLGAYRPVNHPSGRDHRHSVTRLCRKVAA